MLKYINELSGTIELRDILIRAEGLFRRFERTVNVVERKDALPGPSEAVLRQRKKERNAEIKAAMVGGPGGAYEEAGEYERGWKAESRR